MRAAHGNLDDLQASQICCVDWGRNENAVAGRPQPQLTSLVLAERKYAAVLSQQQTVVADRSDLDDLSTTEVRRVDRRGHRCYTARCPQARGTIVTVVAERKHAAVVGQQQTELGSCGYLD